MSRASSASSRMVRSACGRRAEVRRTVAERLAEARDAPRATGHVPLGLFLGLTAAELDAEARARPAA